MARGTLPFTPKIAKPCQESWGAMQGGVRERHCEVCDKQVHNFAAMTSREIERLVCETGGELCARITRREDGSLVTLDARPKTSVAAQIVASASLAIGAAGVAAQSAPPDGAKGQAVLTGTVLEPDGSGPVDGAVVSLRLSNAAVATAKSDLSGNFQVVVPPGTYDVLIRKNILFGTRIYAATLHEGEQSLEHIKTHFYYIHDDGSPFAVTTTMGEVVSIPNYTFAGAVRHPWSYLKYLKRKL